MRVLSIALFAVAAHAAQASVVDRKHANRRDLQGDITAADKKEEFVIPRCGLPTSPCCHAASGKDALSSPCLDGTGCNYDDRNDQFDIGTCQTACGGDYQPCCYSVTPSTDGRDDVTCECAPGLSYSIAAKRCLPCGVVGAPPCAGTDCPVGQVSDENKWLLFNFLVLGSVNTGDPLFSGLLPFLLDGILTGGSDEIRRRVSETETPAVKFDMVSMIEQFSPASMFGGRRGPSGLDGGPVCVPCGELGQLPCLLPSGLSSQCSGDLEVFNLIGYIQESGIRSEDLDGFYRFFEGGMESLPDDAVQRPVRDGPSLPPQIYFLFLGLNICLPKKNNDIFCEGSLWSPSESELVTCNPWSFFNNLTLPAFTGPVSVAPEADTTRASLNATAAEPVPPEPTESESTEVPSEPTV